MPSFDVNTVKENCENSFNIFLSGYIVPFKFYNFEKLQKNWNVYNIV